jgi:ADP-heptose:LPS heptosyltransferase
MREQNYLASSLAYRKQRDIEAALNDLDAAENQGADPNQCSALRWECRMLVGDFEAAWRESDKIASRMQQDPLALWDGQPLDGRRVIVRCLHGFGDAIQFLRYASLLKQRCPAVIVETHPEMVRLLSCLPDVDRLITWAEPHNIEREDWDAQVEVMELPRIFRTTIKTVPAEVPYLKVPLREKPRLPLTGKPRIGVVWASSSWNPARSLPFKELLPLFGLDGFTFLSFQRGSERTENNGVIADITEGAPNILDTAQDLREIDLLITVDTMAAHLASALAIPVWTLLPWDADWRWMLDREDTPWYPTMRLFRQPAQHSGWQPVIERIHRELRHNFCDRSTLDRRLHPPVL